MLDFFVAVGGFFMSLWMLICSFLLVLTIDNSGNTLLDKTITVN